MPPNFFPLVTILVVVFLISGCDYFHQSEADVSQHMRSLNSDTPALITFVNGSDQSVDIYWIDFGGNRQLYKTLETGGSFSQQTYLTHPWLITDVRGQLWNVDLPEARPRTVYLQAPSAAVTIHQTNGP